MFLANNLLAMYVDHSLLKDARRLFDEMLERNIVTWTTMMSAYTNTGSPDTALKFHVQMLESKSEIPNGVLYSAGDLESEYGRECLMEEAMNLFYRVPELDTVSWNSIIAGFVWIESLGALEFLCNRRFGDLQ